MTVLLSEDFSGQALLRAAVGIEAVDRGASVLQGHTLSRQPEEPISLTPLQVGLLSQQPMSKPGQSVDDHIGQWLDQAPDLDRQERIRRVGESLGFDGLGTARVDDLPPALQHRVSIGRALAPAPAMLAADNPFSQLPFRERRMLEGLMRVIASDYGLPVLYATDHVESATRGHHVVRISGGRVVEDVHGWVEIQRTFGSY